MWSTKLQTQRRMVAAWEWFTTIFYAWAGSNGLLVKKYNQTPEFAGGDPSSMLVIICLTG